MATVNCFEARKKGLSFDFYAGIEFTEVTDALMFINGIGFIPFIPPKTVKEKNIEEVFEKEEGMWIGKIEDSVFLFQAGITEDDNFLVPISEEPQFLQSKYVKIVCEKEDEALILGDGRIISRVFSEKEQFVFVEMKKEAVVTVESQRGQTAMFKFDKVFTTV